MNELLSVLSLIVAMLAVIVGPCVSYIIAKRQVASFLSTSHKQVIAPMRQAWINSLRDMLAELTGNAEHYWAAGFEDRTEFEYQQLNLLEHKIRLMLNPNEDDHTNLEAAIRRMMSSLSRGRERDDQFHESRVEVMALSRKVLKREWNVVKENIETSTQTN